MPGFTIKFYTHSVALLFKNKRVLKKCLFELIGQEKYGFNSGEVSVIFCDDKYLYNLNKKFLNHSTFTDIITFNYSDGNFLNGEIYISLERVKENAKKYSQPYKRELTRVVIHGFLHLCGFKDKTPEDKLHMTQKEDFYLQVFEKSFKEKND